MAEENKPKSVELTPAEQTRVRDALMKRFGVHLRPGESMFVDAERTAEHAWLKVEISASDDTFHLEVECASLPADAAAGAWKADAAFDDVLDMVDVQLAEFFEEERFLPLHDDWRIYDFEGSALRFRGRQGRPDLEALADAWLAGGGADDDGEPS